jgi:hypothetical protein
LEGNESQLVLVRVAQRRGCPVTALSDIRARLEKATGRPWRYDYYHSTIYDEGDGLICCEVDDDNADFIIHAPEDTARLRALLDEARETLGELATGAWELAGCHHSEGPEECPHLESCSFTGPTCCAIVKADALLKRLEG